MTAVIKPVVELALNASPTQAPSTWSRTDVSQWVRWQSGLNIVCGRQDEGSTVDPGAVTCTFDNRDGRFGRRNAMGVWWGQLADNTPLWGRLRRVFDAFGRTVANGWTIADSGQAWTTAGGSAADYSVGSGYGKHTVTAVNSFRYTVAAANLRDVELLCTANVAVLATGASLRPAVVARYADVSNYYYAETILNTDQTVSINIGKNVAGAFTQLATAATALTHTTGRRLRIRFAVDGSTLGAKVWDEAGTEPSGWQVSATDTALSGPGNAGCRSLRATGNTNSNAVFNFDDFYLHVDLATVFVPEWTPRWDMSGNDATVPIKGGGILRRFTQGTQPSYSPLRRAISDAANLLSYWSAEDEPDATQVASAIPGQPAMSVSGTALFGNYEAATSLGGTIRYGSANLVNIKGGATFTGKVAASAATQWTVQVLTRNTTGATDLTIMEWRTPGGTFVRWQLILKWSDTSANVVGYTAAGVATTVITTVGLTTSLSTYHIDATQNGANVDVRLWDGGALDTSGTAVTNTIAPIDTIMINPASAVVAVDWPIGHIAAWDTKDPPRFGTFTDGYGQIILGVHVSSLYETAHDRLIRLSNEDNINFVLLAPVTDADLVTRMGSQQPGSAVELWRQCETADMGILFERNFGLAYLPRAARYNAAVDFTATFGDLASPPQPADDDQQRRNQIEVSRPGGSSAVARAESYTAGDVIFPADKVDAVLASDVPLGDQAGFRARAASVTDLRWPQVTINFFGRPDALLDAFLNCRIGSRVQITGPPPEIVGNDIDGILEGYTVERLAPDEFTVTMNINPYSPWLVAEVDGNTRVATDANSTLTVGYNTSATSLSVASAGGFGWTTDAADFPFDVMIAGQRNRVDQVGDVLNANAFMAANASGWTGNGATLAYSATQQYNPAWGSLLVTPNGGVSADARTTTRPAATAATQYLIGAWIRPNTAWAAGFRIGIDWYTATVGGSYISTTFSGTAVVLTAGAWTYVSGIVTAPATTGGGQLFAVQSGTPAATDTWRVTSIVMIPVSSYTGSPQIFTVVRSINGVVKSLPSGSNVEVADPAYVAL
jgi:hypothetical protein